MSDILTKDKPYYIYAEYNPYWIYMGWWLYAIPIDNLTDERDMEKWEQADWLRYDWRLQALFEGLRIDIPHSYHYNSSEYCPLFMRKYPAGVVCQVKGDGREFIPQESDILGDYLRIVRQRQLNHIAKAQKDSEEEKDEMSNFRRIEE